MATTNTSEKPVARFMGTRWRLASILLIGYILMLPTFGIYRFWLVTRKRRFYWSHTEIDSDALEYTGTARQLLIGFLIALAIFLPLYGFFFYLSTQSAQATIYGYSGAAIFLFFLAGYALYRARRFRLTRTLWRGIRFHQSGSAWAYASLRFFWFVVTGITAGLAYPFMAASLWRYRYEHTWYGDRQFSFNGSWKTVAGPFYTVYFLAVGIIAGGLALIPDSEGNSAISQAGMPAGAILPLVAVGVIFLPLAYFFLLSRFTSRLFSSVCAGGAKLKVRVRARSLFWQYFFYALMVSLALLAALMAVGVVTSDIIDPMLAGKNLEISEVLQLGWYNLAMLGLVYLALLAVFSLLTETILGLGFWRLVARGTMIQNVADLKTVRAGGEESTLAGEGLADALNVGAY